MKEDHKCSLLLARPFLTTARALMNVKTGELTFRVGGQRMGYKVFQGGKIIGRQKRPQKKRQPGRTIPGEKEMKHATILETHINKYSIQMKKEKEDPE
ncbi:hypothetical protein MTR_8g037225 [Medicago truncatula]|uniref:Uncharacterized protein n=1 Tax=Medicago truncatula TaxID=3880 RepID=G8A1T5_MEDTR|nr:hypothetical protein MTR_8g037225 [Medicago truncatula]